MPNGWEALVGELVNKYSAKKNQHTLKGVCKAAAIYSIEGVCYASHPPTWQLSKYTFDCPQDDGSTKPIPVDEVKSAIAASLGKRDGGTGGAGIRMGNEKYVFMTPSTEVDKGAYLSRKGGGGATVVQTPKCIVIGIWDKDAKRSDGLC